MTSQNHSDYLAMFEERKKYVHPDLREFLKLSLLHRLLSKLMTRPISDELKEKLDDLLHRMTPERLRDKSHARLLATCITEFIQEAETALNLKSTEFYQERGRGIGMLLGAIIASIQVLRTGSAMPLALYPALGIGIGYGIGYILQLLAAKRGRTY